MLIIKQNLKFGLFEKRIYNLVMGFKIIIFLWFVFVFHCPLWNNTAGCTLCVALIRFRFPCARTRRVISQIKQISPQSRAREKSHKHKTRHFTPIISPNSELVAASAMRFVAHLTSVWHSRFARLFTGSTSSGQWEVKIGAARRSSKLVNAAFYRCERARGRTVIYMGWEKKIIYIEIDVSAR